MIRTSGKNNSIQRFFLTALLVFIFSPLVGFAADFYVDPSYTGSISTGSQNSPWKTLGTTEWSAINNSLSSQDANVFFSARKAGSDSDEVYGAPDEIDITKRTDTHSTTLTFNGRSFYNTNDTTPNWQAYSGTSMCNVRDFNAQNDAHVKYSKITIDGFRISMTVAGKAVDICGDTWTVKNCDIFHTASATDGPLVLLVPTADANNEGSSAYCQRMSSITIVNNKIHDSNGELIYVGGGGCIYTGVDHPNVGSECMGFPSHDNITIQGNEIYNGAVYGHQGDGIDVKGGLSNSKIIGNDIHALNSPTQDVRAIVQQGARPTDIQNNVIADNYIHDCTGIEDAAISLVDSWGTPHGVEIRNNIISKTNATAMKAYAGTGITLYNNTVNSNSGTGILLGGGNSAPQVTIKNNLLIGNGSTVSLSAGSVTNANNGYSGSWDGTPCSSCVSGLTTSIFSDAFGRLTSTAGAIDKGTPLTSFSTDKDGVARPQGSAWDIGAYETAAPVLGSIYYVDPTYTGSTFTGSATQPWKSLTSTAWSTINSSLAGNDVTVYLSALQTNLTQESQAWFLEGQRTDTSTHRLTIDGASKYNTNDASPNWVNNPTPIDQAYLTNKVFKLTGDGTSALGWTRFSNHPKQSYVTIRGFEITGNGSRTSFSGDHTTFEYLNIHDITGAAPAMGILYTYFDDCTQVKDLTTGQWIGPSTDMKIQNVKIDGTVGEAIYLGSINPDCPETVQCQMGNQHSNILIATVTIKNAGKNLNSTGSIEQGDGIDSKNGITGLTVRNVDISLFNGMAGIILPQTFSNGTNQNSLIENAYIHDSMNWGGSNEMMAIYGLASTNACNQKGYDGVTVRNTVVKGTQRGIEINKGGTSSPVNRIHLYNNTVTGVAGSGLVLGVDSTLDLQNNLVFGNNSNGSQASITVGSGANRDYNLWSPAAPSGEGTHSPVVTAANQSSLTVNPSAGDLHLQSGSPAIDKGISVSGFSADKDNVARPQGSAWDIGAYEFGSSGSIVPPHPADSDSNYRMTLEEATHFSYCWKSGSPIPSGCPNPAPSDYQNDATRAGMLWNSTGDGRYQYNSTQLCPLCWEPAP